LFKDLRLIDNNRTVKRACKNFNLLKIIYLILMVNSPGSLGQMEEMKIEMLKQIRKVPVMHLSFSFGFPEGLEIKYCFQEIC
jgi:hypothetical protein